MNGRVLILYLEDDPRDAELVREKLRQAGLPCELRIARDRSEYEAALAETRFDLILSDYKLPDYEGIAALALARTKQPDAPFILISGTLGEEEAVNCVLRGATDYVLKHRLERLLPAMLRALTEAEDYQKRREADAELHCSAQRYKRLQELLRNVADVMPDMVWAKDLDRNFIFVNQAVCDGLLCAKDTDEPIGKSDMFFVERERKAHPDNPQWHTFGEICIDSDSAVLASGSTGQFDEFGNVRGRFLALDVIKTPLRDESGKIIGTVGAGRNVTERKRAEAALRESEALLSSIAENSMDVIFVKDRECRFVFMNPAGYRLNGLTPAQLIGRSKSDFHAHPEEAARFMADDRRVIESGRMETIEEEVSAGDGARRVFLTTKVPRNDGQGKIIGLIGIAHDITERKRAEAAVKKSEANFRVFFDTFDDIILVGTPEGMIIYSNPAVCRKLGYSQEEIRGMHLLDLHAVDKRQEADAIISAMLKGERDSCPLPLQSKSGTYVPVETRVWFGKWNGDDCIFGVSKDLAKEQEALQKFDRLFRSNPTPLAVSSLPDRRFTDINDAFLKLLGYTREEVLGKTTAELGLFLHPEKHEKAGEDVMVHGKISNCELNVKGKDGTIFNGLFSGEVIASHGQKYLLSVMIDQTERKLAEAELSRQLDELRRWQTVALGREGRIGELKREVNALAKRLGENPRYESVASH